MDNGKCIIFSAPSGAGKTTIVHHLLEQNLGLEFSVSACSREKRPKETEGIDYYFMTVDEFKNKITKGDFIEWEEVYKDHYYGTLRSEITRIWNNGKNVIFDIDVKGGLTLKKIFGKKALAVFVMPPSVEVLEKRLRSRSTETEERINTRVEKAKKEIHFADQFDVIVKNDDLNSALNESYQLVHDFLKEKITTSTS